MVSCGMFYFRPLLSLFLVSLIFSQDLHALQTHQIMRKLDQEDREESEFERTQERIELRKAIQKEKNKKRDPAFHIHEEIVCSDANESPEGVSEMVKKSRFSKKIVKDSPKHFSLMTEVIKAHLHIAETLYKKGEFIDSNQPRFHTDDESFFYPDDTLKESVFDVYKSPLYIKHVIMPVLRPFMTKQEYYDTHLRLDFLRAPTELPKGMKTHKYIDADGKKQHFKYYKAHIDVLTQRFDMMRQRYFRIKGWDYNNKIITGTVLELYYHAWQAYKNTSICPYYSKITHPALETYYDALPDYHDTYVMGYGLLARAEALLEENIIASDRFNVKERQFLLKVMGNFRDIYSNIIMDEEKRISYARFEKSFMIFRNILKKHFLQ